MYVNLENAIEILGTTGSQIKIVIPIQIQLFFIFYISVCVVHRYYCITHTGTRFTGTCHVCMYVCVCICIICVCRRLYVLYYCTPVPNL